MNADRWRQVSRVYGAVLTKSPDARAAALAELCADDLELRRDVESLLREEGGAPVLDRPAGDVAAALLPVDLTARTLGAYRLDALIGAGGMGQVYRATDTRLHRTVAVKVLPSALAEDPQFRGRFDREARAIAALNHPHICTLHDVGHDGAIAYLVMELVEGESLAARLERGQVPFAQALTYAIEIADALAAAHRQGIVHRDLKPGNVMVTKTGVKLLDFGLAKAGAGGTGLTSGPLSMLPTTPPVGHTLGTPLTAQGTILGTFQYMAPEQLEGKEADARTDIFAFGALAYELFTGHKAFEGKSQASLIGAIMHAESAPIASTQPLAPITLDRTIAACLAKAPDDRWQSVSDLARELRWIAEGSAISSAETSRLSIVPWVVAGAAVLLTGLLAAAVALRPAPSVSSQPVTRFSLGGTGAEAVWIGAGDPSLAITPDGSKIVYVGDNGSRLFVRSFGRLESTPLASGPLRSPFVSPDGKWAGFVDGIFFKRVAVEGGASVTIGSTDRKGARGVAWMPDNTLVFASNDNTTGLLRIPALGTDGEPEVLTRPDTAKGEADHVWPSALPDGSGVLFTITARTGGLDAAQIALFDLRTKAVTILLRHGTQARYLPDGHLLYGSRETLFAVPFDLKRRVLTGVAVPVLQGVRTTGTGETDYAIADNGTLVYIAAGGVSSGANASGPTRTLVWVDRAGHEEALGAPVRAYAEPRISPDGSRVVIYCADFEHDLWIWDTRRRTLARLTSDPNVDQSPVWTQDGKRIVFTSDRGPMSGVFNLWWKRTDDDPAAVERLTADDTHAQFPLTLSPDGTELLFREITPDTRRHLMKMPLHANAPAVPVVETSARVRNGEVSPDTRWLAFDSDSSGTVEVYVRSLSENGGQWPVSTGGGSRPHWARSGKELFFVATDGSLMKVNVSAQPDWNASAPTNVLPAGYYTNPIGERFSGRHYDVTPDAQRFLMIKPNGDTPAPAIVVVEHFAEELRTRVPAKDK